MESEILPETRKYFFRGLHPLISIGTASDRYKGWLGQIYSEHLYAGRITSRKNTVGKNSFRVEVLPVDSVREYFQHFRILEVDYTFYSPLIENGVPTRSAGTLTEYAAHMGPDDRVFLKVPQMFLARKLRRGKDHVPNEMYLAAGPFTRQFYEPAVRLLGPGLKGFIFEQEYQRSTERVPREEFAREFGRFFEAIPRDSRYHVELRTDSYLSPQLFDVLKRFGIGQILSHWTWLPSLAAQFRRSGERFVHAGGQAVIRLMTPKDVRYEDAYARAFPFDAIREDLLQQRMISETAELMCEGIRQGVEVNVIINNRSGGNAPDIGRRLVQLFMELRGKKEGTAR
ncbi:MAG: DUF72 domain-containing protein [Desulfobacteraceae bacterium]|nr:DUF72 domain-containing protein [Desulfobacteraceae bacterium]